MALVHIFGERPIPKTLDFFRVNQFWDYSIKEVSLETHVSYRTLQKIIPDLVQKDILKETRIVAKAKMYQFNKESLLCKELIRIARESDLEFGEQLIEKEKIPIAVTA